MFQAISEIITYDLLSLAKESSAGVSTQFFVYSIIKLPVLIVLVITVISFIRTLVRPGKMKEVMGKSRFGLGNVAASTFGAITPFCTCSSIPIFIGFLEAEIPLGIAFSYLITSPLVNEVAFVIMGDFFGWKLASIYALTGIALGVIGGLILGALKLDKEIILKKGEGYDMPITMPKKFKDKIKFALKESLGTLKKLIPYILVGVTIGALIHGYVPKELFINTLDKYKSFSVFIATFIGIPIYAGCSMVAPIIFTITTNGVPLGTSLALMMAIAGLSLPEAIILKRVMTFKLLSIFFSLVAVGIIIVGFLFNAIA